MGCARTPVGECIGRGQPVERAVVVDRRDRRSVVLQPLSGGHALAVEGSAPVAVLPAGRAYHHGHAVVPSRQQAISLLLSPSPVSTAALSGRPSTGDPTALDQPAGAYRKAWPKQSIAVQKG